VRDRARDALSTSRFGLLIRDAGTSKKGAASWQLPITLVGESRYWFHADAMQDPVSRNLNRHH
jgi:hypothetical protein